MADYNNITGYIEDIYEGETGMSGKAYLGIKFYTQDPHDNDSGRHEIRWWFSENALEMTNDKIGRLLEMAGLVAPKQKVKTVEAALKLLSKPELAALEIPVTVSPNEYEGKVRAQYDLGWDANANVKQSGFTKFGDLVAERMAEIKAKAPKAAPSAPSASEASSTVYDDDIPF